MGKSSSGRDRAGSEMSSRSDKRRSYDPDSSRRRSGAESTTSSSRRKSTRRDEYDDDGATFAPTITEEPSEMADRRRNSSRREYDYDDTQRRSSKGDRGSKDDRRRGDVSGVAREDSRRESYRSGKSGRREKEKGGSTRALGDHDAALPQNQFPGEFPDTYTQPYRPPGLAAEYYNDQGESVLFQPGVRPNQPNILTNAEQAHLMEPTTEPKPPPEPSSVGQLGAAASFYGDTNYENDSGHQTTPSKPPRLSSGPSRPSKHSAYGASPRSSPGPLGNSAPSAHTPGGMGFAPPAAAVVGAAAEYYAGASGGGSASAYQTPNRPPPVSQPGFTPYSAPPGIGGSQHHSNAALYGGSAALAGVAAGAYMSSHAHEHHSHGQQQTSTHASAYANGYGQSHGTHMHQVHRHKHKGLFGRLVDWWRDPEAIAQYEQYTEAIGVCKYCFDPMSTPADAPRKHGYRRRTPSGSRHGSTTRVDKTYRYSSDEERRRRTGTKVALGGLAGYGVAKMGEAIYKQRHDFDDTYPVKSGRPANQSRVSFHDEPQYERYGDVRLQRRDSDRKSNKVKNSSHEEKRRTRRSRSSSSSSSSHGVSRGAAMSVGGAVAGAAMGAAALDRKSRRQSRSRSRSPTSRRRYYSKRVSPMHSYVDLSTTNDGPGGLLGFFTSPSANTKKGKKPKGLFNFANDSSSSSDADLQFGAGTVRRKHSTSRLRTRHGKPERDPSAAAMMGMVAAGTALAAEVDRKHEKGKGRHGTDKYAGRTPRHAGEHRISLDDHEIGGRDDEWYDTDGDAESETSVDTALAYGGGLSAAQSRESLAQDRKSTRPSHNFREADQRRYHDDPAGHTPSISFPDSAAQTTVAVPVVGAMGGWMASDAIRQDPKSAVGPLPPMREVEPRPVSDPPSKPDTPQTTRVSSTSIPLEHPQPIVPVPPFFSEIGSQSIEHQRRPGRDARSERRRPRRDSSPAKLPTQDPRSGVNFSLTDEQLENERRAKDRDGRRKVGSSDKDRWKSNDAAILTTQAEPPRQETKTRARRSSEATRRSSDGDDRVAEIERELERLYEEHRQAEERKRKRESGLKKVAGGAAIGAAAALAATALAEKDSKAGSGDESTPKRKSNLKKSRERESSPQSETQQEILAKMIAQRVRSTPSPVQHEDYKDFFLPPEIKEHLKEHNDKAEHRDDIEATVVEIVPGAPKPRQAHPFDPFTYRHFGLDENDDPSLYPWPVPMLALVEPTPPGSQAHSMRGDETPVIEPKSTEPLEEIGEPLERRESKVTWGDHDTYVYEVQTPEYERTDFAPDMETREPKFADMPSPDEIVDEPGLSGEHTQARPSLGRTWTLEETEAEKLEKEVPVIDDRPLISRAWTVDEEEADEIERGVSESPTNDGAAVSEPDPHIIGIAAESQGAPASIVAEPEELPRAPSPPASAFADTTEPSASEQYSPELESTTATPPPIRGTDSVPNYPVNGKGGDSPSTSVLGLGASAVLIADQLAKTREQHGQPRSAASAEVDQPSKPKRSSTSDEPKSQRSRSGSKAGYQSDPEDWERSTDRVKKPKSSSKSDVGAKTSSKSKSRREVEEPALVPLPKLPDGDDLEEDMPSRRSSRHSHRDFDEESTISRRSRDEDKKSRSRRSRDADGYRDDDTRSVASSDSKGKKKESGGFFSGIFSSNKSDVSTSSRKSSKSTKSESRADRDRDDRSESRRKRKSRDKADLDDVVSAVSEPTRERRRSSDLHEAVPDRNELSRDQSLDDGFVSAEEAAESPVKNVRDGESFLASRPEMPEPTVMDIPMGTDGVSGPISERDPSARPDTVVRTPVKAPVGAEDDGLEPPASPLTGREHTGLWPSEPVGALESEAASSKLDSSPVLPQYAESRRLSAIRTGDLPSSPITTSSPTAIPIQFRRPAISPTNPRFSMSSPVAAPSSPLSTPRTRQGRPKSTEFRNSKEFRPLYLVERQNFAKTAATEPEEDLPSLPSSRTSSAHPSMEDLRAESLAREQSEYILPSRMNAETFRERGRRHSYSYWHDVKRRESPDYLDSRSATPVPGEAQRARDQEPKPKPKYEFHSPSELLQDPALLRDMTPVDDADAPQSPLPSVVSTDFDQDYMSARSRSLSPTTRARSLSRGRRSTSTTRSPSASWHDALTTAAAGVLAGSALGIAAQEVLREPSDDVPPNEVTTPRKLEFAAPEGRDSVDVKQARTLPASVPQTEHPSLERSAEPQPEEESQITAEKGRDSSAWKNVFAELHKRDRDLGSVSQNLPVVTDDTSGPEGLTEDAAREAPLPAPPAPAPVQEVGEGDHSILSEVREPTPQVEDSELLAEDDLQQTVRGAEEPAQESSNKSKKAKKDRRGRKKKTTLILGEDPPLTPQESVVPDKSDAELKDLSPHEVPATNQEPSLDLDRSVEAAAEVPPTLVALDVPSSTAVEDEQNDIDGPHQQIAISADKTIDHETPAPAETKPSMTPLEEAFEAALHTRGLADGATALAAYQSFQPEIPDVGGTPLTTIQEEGELPTPATEQEPTATELDALVGRKPSKKEKRRQKKARQTLSDDWPEADKQETDVDQSVAVVGADRILPEERVFAEPTPADERPNPFGNDFEIKPGEVDVQTAAVGGSETLVGSTGETDSGQAPPKKGKKDKKKKKRQSSNREGEVATEQAETVVQAEATDPDTRAVPDNTTAMEQADAPSREVAPEEDMFATPAESPEKESEDPWGLTSKPEPSKSKESLPSTVGDSTATAAEGSQALTAPISEPERSTHEVADLPVKSQDAVFTEQTIQESEIATRGVADMAERDQVSISEATKEEQVPHPQPDEKLSSGDVEGGSNALEATAAAALIAMDHPREISDPILKAPESVVEKSQAEDVAEAAKSDGPGLVKDADDVDTKDTTEISIPQVSDGRDEAMEQLEPETATIPSLNVHEVTHIPDPSDREHGEDSIASRISEDASAEVPSGEHESQPQQEEDPFPIVKKSKKDKKKKRTATSDDPQEVNLSREPPLAGEETTRSEFPPTTEDEKETEEPAPLAPAEAQSQIAPTPDEVIASPQALTKDLPQQEDDDLMSFPVKKSKDKKKKKKRQSALAETDIVSSAESAVVTDDKTVDSDIAREVGPDDPTADTEAVPPVEEEPRQDEDLFPVPTKSKGKGKKRRSNLTIDQPDVSPSPETVVSAGNNQDSSGFEDTIAADASPPAETDDFQADSASTPAKEVPAEMDDDFTSTKKSKKSKKEKKKRQTITNDFDEPQRDAVVGQEAETALTTFPEQLPEPGATAEDSVETTDDIQRPERTDAQAVDADIAQIPDAKSTGDSPAELVRDAAATRHLTGPATDLELSSTWPVPPSEEQQTKDTPGEQSASDHLADKAPEVEAPVVESPIDPAMSGASVAEAPVHDPVSIGTTATVEPPTVEAPVVQSPVSEAAALGTSVNSEPVVETDSRSRVDEADVAAPRAVETRTVELATVQAPVIETPADDVAAPGASAAQVDVTSADDVTATGAFGADATALELPSLPSGADGAHGDAVVAVETAVADHTSTETQVPETETDETSKVATDVLDPTAVDVPPVETPVVEAPVVETPASESAAVSLAGLETPPDDEWGIPVKKSKKDKKKKRQSALAAEIPKSETPMSGTRDCSDASEPALEVADELVSHEAPLPEGDIPKSDFDMRNNAEDVSAPTPKSKKDKKKKKRQSTLAALLNDPEGTTDNAEELAQESQPNDAEVPTTSLETAREAQEPTLEGDTDMPTAVAPEPRAPDSEEAARVIAGDEEAFTASKSKKDKKKKKRQSTLVDDMVAVEAAADDTKPTIEESKPIVSEALDDVAPGTDEPIITINDEVEAQQTSFPDDIAPADASAAQEVPEDEWAFTSAKSKKDKKKKRQSTLESPAVQLARAEGNETRSLTESVTDSPDGATPTESAVESGGENGPAFLNDDSNDPQAPTSKKRKEKKKALKSKLDKVSTVDEVQGESESRDVEVGKDRDLRPNMENEEAQAIEATGDGTISAKADLHPTSLAESEKTTAEHELAESASIALPTESGQIPDLPSLRPDEVKEQREETKLEAQEKKSVAKDAEEVPVPPESEALLMKDTTSPETAEQDLTVSGSRDPAPDDQTLDYFSLSRKKSKKDKKKKRQAALDEPQTSDAFETPMESATPAEPLQTPLEETERLTGPDAPTETPGSPLIGTEGTVPHAEEEKATSTKTKSKKGKKERQLVLEDQEPVEAAETPLEREDSFQLPAEGAEPVTEEDWFKPTSAKSKKGKKKQRSTFDDAPIEPTQATPQAGPAHEADANDSFSESRMLEEAPQTEQEDWNVSKKTRNQKKKRQSTFDDAFGEPDVVTKEPEPVAATIAAESVLEPSVSEAHQETTMEPALADTISSQAQSEVDNYNVSNKKKNKKKKRQSTFTDFGDDPVAVEAAGTAIAPEVEERHEPSQTVDMAGDSSNTRQLEADGVQAPSEATAIVQDLQPANDPDREGEVLTKDAPLDVHPPGGAPAHEEVTAKEAPVPSAGKLIESSPEQLESINESPAEVHASTVSDESRPDLEPMLDSLKAPEPADVSTAVGPVGDQPTRAPTEEPQDQGIAIPSTPSIVETGESQMIEESKSDVLKTTQDEQVEPARSSLADTPMIMETDEPRTEPHYLNTERGVPEQQSEVPAPAPDVPAPEIPASDDLRVAKTKKTKKKKRQSTWEEDDFDQQQNESGELESTLRAPPAESPVETQALAPGPVDLPPTDATPMEPNVEAQSAVPSKKSKKGKKNRQSTFDESSLDLPQTETPAAVAEAEMAKPGDVPMLDAADEPTIQPQTTDPIMAEDWGAFSKKSKKDKKKKRKTLLAEEQSQPSTPLEETPLEKSVVDEQQADVDVTTPSPQQHEANPTSEVHLESDKPTEAAVLLTGEQHPESEPLARGESNEVTLPTDQTLAEDEWAIPTKKSKKDKKKKKQRLTLDDIDMEESQPATPAEPGAAKEAIEQPAEDISGGSREEPSLEAKVEQGGPESPESESPAQQLQMAEAMEEVPEELTMQAEEPSGSLPAADLMDVTSEKATTIPSKDYVQEADLKTGPPGPASEGERELVAPTDEPTPIENEWPPAKKPKKEKRKSKRQSTLETTSQPQAPIPTPVEAPEFVDVPHADVIADVQQPTDDVVPGETQAQEEWGFSTKKPKKGKKGRALAMGDAITTPGSETPRSSDQFESAVQTPLDRTASPEPMEDVKGTETPAAQLEANDDGYFAPTPSKKKSKKDKKKKSLLTWSADDQPTEDVSKRGTSTPALEPEPNEDTGHGMEANVEPVAPAARDDLDTTESTNGHDAPKTAEDLEMTTVAPAPEAIHDQSVLGDQHEVLMPDSHISVADKPEPEVDEPPREIDVDQAQALDILPKEIQPDVITDSLQTARGIDAELALPENAPPTHEEQPPQRKKSKKDKKAKKERRVFEFDGTENIAAPVVEHEEADVRGLDVMEPIAEEPVEPSPAPAPTQEPQPRADVENLSDVSESTRERRRRRRTPPVWSGEEPDDLPRDRALTPPPEHDDIMDTALGIAAGLGFGGREPEATREAPSKPRSPARQASAGWSFARLAPGVAAESNRDSGVQFESPILATGQFSSTRDSGFIPSPATAHGEFGDSRDESTEMKLRPPRPQSPTSSTEDVSKPRASNTRHEERATLETPRRKPSPVESTSKERTSVLFNSSPALPSPLITTGIARSPELGQSPLRRSPSIHGHHHSREELRQQKAKGVARHEDSEQLASNLIDRSAAAPINRSVFDAESHDRPFTPARSALGAIREDSAETSGVAHPLSGAAPTLPPGRHGDKDDGSALGLVAAAGAAGIAAAALASRDSGAKSLGRSKSRTSSLRNLRGSSISPFDPASFASASSSQDPVNARDTGKTAVRDRDMAEIYVRSHASTPLARSPKLTALQDGYGSYPGSPRSPTRPPSVRRRQSMQQIKDLEARLDQLASENRALVEAKIVAEQHLEHAHFEQNRSEQTSAAFNAQLHERDAEIARLKQEVASLVATHESLKKEHEQSLFNLQQEHHQALSQWQGSSRELETLRSKHMELSTGMESIVRHEIDSALAEKNAEIQRLRSDLEVAREKIRKLQSQILERPVDDVVAFHDEDYFDQACQKLCRQVQGWVLRFSKSSDLKLCRTTSEVRVEKIVDKFDNAILDGSEVDVYLADRVKRRDVFMSVVMTMIWEYVFTRYLFGMDREQRQKLKQLEKNLGEVGPPSAVHQWRALTLTLLSKRESFKALRESDAEAVAIEIFSTLSRFLPPPQHLEEQIVGSLRNVMRTAVELSIEMRTQRAEYIMLPPLQPEYDTNGDLARKVYFKASLMNERSGETTSNEELERNKAVVRMVLFPLVVKKGDDNGVGDEEIVVCPAQVLIARPDKAKKPRSSTRHVSGGSDAKSLRAISTHSLAMSGIEGNENMF
ncbi:hypothetical protein PV04_03874 [Phialophora macrospora]|uniref:Involucrin repeat protein n=1 Tax=Phialophora macrospora TaxID=1851006 RepID=A0A0D2GHI2_9EURO|nr:hypothetical protein PV04_03874 [Phialophora macrospora]